MRKSGRCRLWAIVAFIVVSAYSSVYAFLSISGQYEGDADILDKIYGPCICASEDEYWQPRHVILARYSDKFLVNSYGYLFFPLVKLDQRWWHPTKPIEYRPMTDAELVQWMKKMKEQNK